MTTQEIKTATKLLADRTDRTETIGDGRGGLNLTAHWRDGSGQRMFVSLDEVREHVATHTAN